MEGHQWVWEPRLRWPPCLTAEKTRRKADQPNLTVAAASIVQCPFLPP